MKEETEPTTDNNAPQNQQPPAGGRAPTDIEPMPGGHGFGVVIESVLKKPGRIVHELNGAHRWAVLLRLGVVALASLIIYGVVMGSLSGGSQLWLSPLKLTLGTVFSVLICLPSLYVFLCLSGADVRISHVVGLLVAAICLLSLLLIGFAPVAWIFSQSTDSVVFMGMLHLFFWGIGLWFGLRALAGLIAHTRTSGGSGHLKMWMLIFVLVCLQMTSVVRPLIGTADTILPQEKRFFMVHWVKSMTAGIGVHVR